MFLQGISRFSIGALILLWDFYTSVVRTVDSKFVPKVYRDCNYKIYFNKKPVEDF